MVKRLFLLLPIFFLIGIGFVSAEGECDGCIQSGNCLEYGAQINGGYCDYLTNSIIPLKGLNGDCVNDFECAVNYSCVGGKCDNTYNDFIDLLFSGNLSGFCLGTGLFCYNSTQPSNSTLLNLSCGLGSSCYQCNSPYSWDSNLSRCIPGACTATPGCLNLTSLNLTELNNSEVLDKYCSVGSCFECDSDYDWNNASKNCELKSCTFLPGCKNESNITNAKVANRYCSAGSCFICTSGYTWNNVSNTCVQSDSVITTYGAVVELSSADLDAGTQKNLKIFDKLHFLIGSQAYDLVITSVVTSEQKVVYKIEPVLKSLTAFVGENNKYDLNSDNSYDVNIRLVSINSGQAVISVTKETFTSIVDDDAPVVVDNTPKTPIVQTKNLKESSKNTAGYLVIIFMVFLFIAIVLVIIAIVSKKKQAKKASSDSMANGYRVNY